jgi:hypothetical protein
MSLDNGGALFFVRIIVERYRIEIPLEEPVLSLRRDLDDRRDAKIFDPASNSKISVKIQDLQLQSQILPRSSIPASDYIVWATI